MWVCTANKNVTPDFHLSKALSPRGPWPTGPSCLAFTQSKVTQSIVSKTVGHFICELSPLLFYPLTITFAQWNDSLQVFHPLPGQWVSPRAGSGCCPRCWDIQLLEARIRRALSPTYIFFPGGAGGKEPACQCRRQFNPWVRKIPWRRKWPPAPVFLPGEFQGQRSLVGYSL